MSDKPDTLALAYAEEYRSCKATGQDDRIIAVVEALTRLGWNVDDNTGELVRVGKKERADEAAPENTAQEAPQRRRSSGR